MYELSLKFIIVLCIIVVFLGYHFFKRNKGSSILQVGTIWYVLIIILNLVNIYIMIDSYVKATKKQGKKGVKGDVGPIGKPGASFLCSQCGLAGKKMKPIYSTNINDNGAKIDNDKISPGKCIFPFMHNNEMQYKCVKDPRELNEENDASRFGWCATSLNGDKTYKTYGYCTFSDIEEKKRKEEEIRRRKKREYLLSNTGILDIKLAKGNRSTVSCPTGYTKIDKDLNDSSGGKYIYVCAKKGLGSSGIDKISTTNITNNYKCPNGHRKIPTNLNSGSGGSKIFLCKTKTNKNFLTDIKVQNEKNCPPDYQLATQNLNEGSGGNDVYICVSNKRSDLQSLDTAFVWGKNKKTYFFRGNEFWRYNDAKDAVDKEYPKKINTYWDGIPSNLNAVFTWGKDNKTYFFKGDRFWKFDDQRLIAEPGYPKKIKSFWKGVPDNFDSVFTWKDGFTYFFKGKLYYKFDDKNNKVARGYPRIISKRWPRAPHSINAIFHYVYEDKTYIIRNDKYWVIDNTDTIAQGYPLQIKLKFRGIF